ncbi:Ppx/GppA family phosphatase [Streptomyces sp. NPDC050982]|uniref:Ppx/GppA phosphatase family protein n=1 Tax=Streptomyces sp. NPDC050982 TaxID=3154746 RepID=UPI0033C002F5
MRVSVVDAGSNTVRLAIADTDAGVPLPVHTVKWKLRLSEHVQPDGAIADETLERLIQAVAAAGRTAQDWNASAPLAFATAVVRRAPNRQQVLDTVQARTGIHMRTLPGETEAELTFLAARRWMGWHAGPLAVLDIGGGSLEVAYGRGRLPDFAVSLPLGANRLTHDFFTTQDPPTETEIKALRRTVRHQLRDVAERIRWENPRTVVVTSRTFQQLARLCGAAPGRHGPFKRRTMHRQHLGKAINVLAAVPTAERAQLSGISTPRAAQSLAGAIVGHTAMKLMALRTVTVCPWAVREGVLLRHIEDGEDWWTEITRDTRTAVAPADPLRLAILPAPPGAQSGS